MEDFCFGELYSLAFEVKTLSRKRKVKIDSISHIKTTMCVSVCTREIDERERERERETLAMGYMWSEEIWYN